MVRTLTFQPYCEIEGKHLLAVLIARLAVLIARHCNASASRFDKMKP